jgi:HlyD family secretion protein
MKWLSPRRLFLYAVALAVAAFLVYAFRPKPVDVDVAAVTRGALQVTVDEDGRTRIKERYVVSAPLAGRQARITLRPGDPVTAGQSPLTVIEPSDPALLDERSRAEAEARVKATESGTKRAQAALDQARVAHDYAKAELARAQPLVGTSGVSRQAFEDLQLKERLTAERLREAQFALQIANFELEQAQSALIRTRPRSPGDEATWRFEIRSPISGRVLRVFQESSTVVTPGTRLLELGDPSDLEVEIDVLSADAVRVKPGAKVRFEHWGGGEPLWGRVRLVEPAAFLKVSALGVEEQRVWVIADFTDPYEKRKALGDAYRVEARIVVWEGENVLKVPAGALFRQGDRWAVYVLENGKARLRHVRTGQSNGLETEVHDGLSANERVVVHPSDKIQDGVAVQSR